MACPDPLHCVTQGLSFAGTALAAWQGYRASQLLKAANRLRADAKPPQRPKPTEPAADSSPARNDIPLQTALDTTADALEGVATGWTMRNHVLLIAGILLVLIGSGLSTYRAIFA